LDVVDRGVWEVPQTAPVLLDKPDGLNLVDKMNRKLRGCLLRINSRSRRTDCSGEAKFHVVDLSSDGVPLTPSVLAVTYSELLTLGRSPSTAAADRLHVRLTLLLFVSACFVS